MRELLTFLADHCAFLFVSNQCEITASRVYDGFGDASVTLTTDNVEFVLARERGRFLLTVRPTEEKPRREVYGIGFLRDLMSDGQTPDDYAELDTANLAFLQERFDDIVAAFSREQVEATLLRLKSLQKQRTKERWS